ncbi:hypothetical protein [Microbispora rosea]|uniref:hypothetical protein n=1 Tax=Microbispora rosea TaxID=58117 RepID=UPI00378A414F
MAEPTFVYDSRDPDTRGLEDTPAWHTLLDWMRTQRMNPDQTRRLELYHLNGQWFARTLEYTEAQRWGRLFVPHAGEYVLHTSTYVLNSPPPDVHEVAR